MATPPEKQTKQNENIINRKLYFKFRAGIADSMGGHGTPMPFANVSCIDLIVAIYI